jgi:two-component sensor histidine kinase
MTDLPTSWYFGGLPMEILTGLLIIAGWYVLFYRHHRAASKLQRIILLALFPVCVFVVWFFSGSSITINEMRWAAIIILLASLGGDLKESLFTAIYYIGTEESLDSIRNFTTRYIFEEHVPKDSPAYTLSFVLLYLVVFGWTLGYYQLMKKRRETLPPHFWFIFAMPPIGSTVLLVLFAEIALPLQETMDINIYLIGILLGIFSIVLLQLAVLLKYHLLEYYESHLQAQILHDQTDRYARQIQYIEIGHERTQIIRHEMKNLLIILQSLLIEQNYEEARKRISTVVGELNTGTVKFYTGFSAIDVMLTYKAESLAAYGATLTVHASPLEIPDEAIYDITAMLAIMLDNAIEAAAVGTPPFPLQCGIRQKNHIIVITFTNPLTIPLVYRDGEIVSTKAEKGHGLGIRSLRYLAKKYGGNIEITDTDGLFTIKVLLFTASSPRP